MKKKVGNVDLRIEAFAFVPDPAQPHTWKLPIFHPDKNRELNLVLSAVKRFAETDIPAAIRETVWHRITQQAVRHHVSFPTRMPAAAKPKHHFAPHNQVNRFRQKLSEAEKEEKSIKADADYRAEAFLKSIGFWSDEREDQ